MGWFIMGVVVSTLLLGSIPAEAQKPEMKTLRGVERLYYHGQPFLMLSGELHNSTSSTEYYLAPAMAAAKEMKLNSVIVTVEWDLVEPERGQYDFSTVDTIISLSEKYDLPVVIAWFGTWKNGVSSYIPGWMKRDTQKYFRVKDDQGNATDYISTFCEAACEADQKAFAALMRHIRERDTHHMVLFMQVENETGLWQQNIDNSDEARKAYAGAVPSALTAFLKANESVLVTPMKDKWIENGRKSRGSWKEVFGDNLYTEAFFMQWAYASYIEKVAAAGKKEYDIPMYLNTVAMPTTGMTFNPGAVQGSSAQKKESQSGSPFGSAGPLFPSGAPIYNAIDMYKLFCPSIDFCSPDIYVPAFKNVSDAYTRKDNPLFVPETGRNAAPAYYTLAHNNGIGFSAFAIEDAFLSEDYRGVYSTLTELLPLISEYQGTGLMDAFLKEGNETGTSFTLDGYNVDVKYISSEKASYGLVIKTGKEDFVISGTGAIVTISSDDKNKVTRYERVEEGRFENGEWFTEVVLNGDQTSHGQEVYLRGRVAYEDGVEPSDGELFPRRNVASSEANQQIVTARQKSPSVYNVRVYSYSK
ncbi:MAG: DUF5597 domain-containing protein [Bacteroidales bacterium]|nr:DUF5597 domain-containing protein [Bacteroidales bacterium]